MIRRRSIEAALRKPSVLKGYCETQSGSGNRCCQTFWSWRPTSYSWRCGGRRNWWRRPRSQGRSSVLGVELGANLGLAAGASLEEALKQRRFKKRFGRTPTKRPQAGDYLE